MIELHWIRDNKLHSKSVEPCFVTLRIYESKNPKLIFSRPFVLQCSLINTNDMFYLWLYVIISTNVMHAETRTSPSTAVYISD